MAETENTLTKVDSLVEEAPGKKGHRRASSMAADCYNLLDLEKEGTKIEIALETQKTNWKINTSPTTVEDKDILKQPLCLPKIKKIDLHFRHGLTVTARNLKGVTIKDALDAIYKQFRKKADDELDDAYLAGFEWDPEENYQQFIVHLKKQGAAMPSKKKKKGAAAADE